MYACMSDLSGLYLARMRQQTASHSGGLYKLRVTLRSTRVQRPRRLLLLLLLLGEAELGGGGAERLFILLLLRALRLQPGRRTPGCQIGYYMDPLPAGVTWCLWLRCFGCKMLQNNVKSANVERGANPLPTSSCWSSSVSALRFFCSACSTSVVSISVRLSANCCRRNRVHHDTTHTTTTLEQTRLRSLHFARCIPPSPPEAQEMTTLGSLRNTRDAFFTQRRLRTPPSARALDTGSLSETQKMSTLKTRWKKD
jgi:hypothetical protein